MPELVLFGVGRHTAKYINIIQTFGGKIDFLADNNREKINTKFQGFDILSPRNLTERDCYVIISCIHWKEISSQLSEMGLGDRQISLYYYLKMLIAEGIEDSEFNIQIRAEHTVCMDLYSGERWGGAENWNVTIAKAFFRLGKKVVLVGDEMSYISQKELEGGQIKLQRFRKADTFRDMTKYFAQNLPLIVVNSFFGDNFFALLVLKLLEPNNVKIISVIHNDRPEHYELSLLFDDWIDQYVCVSSMIKDTFVNVYGASPEKVFFLHQPVVIGEKYNRIFNYNKPLRLGIASRLVREQKRCDLIPLLIRQLEILQVGYVLNIAGDGELSDTIFKYIFENDFSHKVHLMGWLTKEEMVHFWKVQDVYINISEYEGTSLSMLEAMETGCVPVVTNVSGAGDFIRDQYNGFLCGINDIEAMAIRVKQIDGDRKLLERLGMNARKEILAKCSLEDYAGKLLDIGGMRCGL